MDEPRRPGPLKPTQGVVDLHFWLSLRSIRYDGSPPLKSAHRLHKQRFDLRLFHGMARAGRDRKAGLGYGAGELPCGDRRGHHVIASGDDLQRHARQTPRRSASAARRRR